MQHQYRVMTPCWILNGHDGRLKISHCPELSTTCKVTQKIFEVSCARSETESYQGIVTCREYTLLYHEVVYTTNSRRVPPDKHRVCRVDAIRWWPSVAYSTAESQARVFTSLRLLKGVANWKV